MNAPGHKGHRWNGSKMPGFRSGRNMTSIRAKGADRGIPPLKMKIPSKTWHVGGPIPPKKIPLYFRHQRGPSMGNGRTNFLTRGYTSSYPPRLVAHPNTAIFSASAVVTAWLLPAPFPQCNLADIADRGQNGKWPRADKHHDFQAKLVDLSAAMARSSPDVYKPLLLMLACCRLFLA